MIRRQVRAIFNDGSRGETPVERSEGGLLGRDTVAWRVHGDITSMMVGGVAALLLQMLHPAVLAGVWDHSNFRTDMIGRLRRTARFIALTTYGTRADAEAAVARVRAIHARIGGMTNNGTPYAADDPRLLSWVHLTETTSFLAAWRRYGEPGMSVADQDRYFAEMSIVARALGADPIPYDRASAEGQTSSFLCDLGADHRTREVAQMVLRQRPPNLALGPMQAMTFTAAIDLLPDWARRMHGFPSPGVARPLVRLGTQGIARTLRWAFR
jgi:uncharacterized protein (DUF2236 family)